MRIAIATLSLPVMLAGCGFSGALSGAANMAPGALGELEQLKVAVAIAPLAGCITEIQQVQMLMNAMQTGTPAIPVSPKSVPPIITAPPPAATPSGTPATVPPPPIPAPKPVPTV